MVEENGFRAFVLLIPVIALVGILLIALLIIFIARILQRMLGKPEISDDFIDKIHKEAELRKNERIDIDSLLVSIDGDFGHLSGTTCNISNSGICINNLPTDKQIYSDSFTAKINTGYQVFNIHVTRKWERIQNNVKIIGAAIEKAPDNWLEFVATEKKYA